tara:strand:+ start:1140 stop:1421 length:282 start_codon:yes stop_codon:yes gene_type:complete
MSLIERIKIAEANKPKMGQPCNHCGWCCMTEVCPVGKACGAGETIPCKFLTNDHKCHLASISADVREALDVGGGCDARTVNEQLEELFGERHV